MEHKLQAVYKQGALHPLEPLQLAEMQEVTITVEDIAEYDASSLFTAEEWERAKHDTVTWEEVRDALSGIRGSLSDTVSEQREER